MSRLCVIWTPALIHTFVCCDLMDVKPWQNLCMAHCMICMNVLLSYAVLKNKSDRLVKAGFSFVLVFVVLTVARRGNVLVPWLCTLMSLRWANDKEEYLCAGGARTGPVNLALWRVPMTRGFTGHKPRGMRESRKWPTVSIFCQTAFRLLSFFSAFARMLVCLSYSDYLVLLCNSHFLFSSFCQSLCLKRTIFLTLSVHTHSMSLMLKSAYWDSALKVRKSL